MKFVADETLFLRGKYLSLTTKKNGLREEPYKKDVKILCQTLLKTSWCHILKIFVYFLIS